MQDMNFRSALTLGLCILLGLVGLGWLGGSSVIRFKEYERTVTVKGLAEAEYPADIVLWPISFTSLDNDLARLYASVEKDTERVVAFLSANGIAGDEITVSPPNIADKLAQGYDQTRVEYRYSSTQVVTVYSEKIEDVRSLMKKMGELGKEGIALVASNYENQTEYLFLRLNQVKPAMIEEATTKAREVAEKFAADSQSRLGKIKSARQGQFSIQDRDRNNPHIKRVRVVTTVEYYLSD